MLAVGFDRELVRGKDLGKMCGKKSAPISIDAGV